MDIFKIKFKSNFYLADGIGYLQVKLLIYYYH